MISCRLTLPIVFLTVFACAEDAVARSKYSHLESTTPSLDDYFVNEGREPRPQERTRENDASFWMNRGMSDLKRRLNTLERPIVNRAKNVVFFLGDGMSLATVTAARVHKEQISVGSFMDKDASLSFEKFPYTGLVRTYCVDKLVADSACSATAYMTGVKANSATLGVTAAVKLNDCKASLIPGNRVDSILRWAQKAGKATGIVTNTRVTHASPAGGYAHSANRDWESNAPGDCLDIAQQLITEAPGTGVKKGVNHTLVERTMVYKPKHIKRSLKTRSTRLPGGKSLPNKVPVLSVPDIALPNVILGGGRRAFLPKNKEGHREDGRDLIIEWKKRMSKSKQRYKYVQNQTELSNLNLGQVDKLLGLFSNSHMSYDGTYEAELDQPSLTHMTWAAIQVLRKNKNGYVLFVEGGRIDHAHHNNMAHMALTETIAFSRAVKKADSSTDPEDTLIVVTSDHSHTMTINGYPSRDDPIVGHVKDHIFTYSILSYANGLSGTSRSKYTIRPSEEGKKFAIFPSLVRMAQETHGGEDVAVWARGPWAHLFVGSFEQSVLPLTMAYASCIGPGEQHCP